MQELLIIDPEKRLEAPIKKLIDGSDTGLNVLACDDVSSAEKAIMSSGEFPMVFIDSDRLPSGGLDAAGRLKELFHGLKIVFVSEHASFELAKAALRLQINGLISFPADGKELLDIISVLAPYSVRCRTSLSGLSRAEQNELIKKKLISDAKAIVEKDIDKDLSLDYVASILNISPCYLSSLFHKVTGQNFMTYVTGFRLDKAAHLLETTNLPVNEVSRRVGYRNPPYFSTIFKKKYGFIPSMLRGMNIK